MKRLAHACLRMYADEFPDLTLLCVNALQKDLLDNDPIVRSLAVRTICSVRSRDLSEHALSTIQKTSLDSSVFVRKCTATCLGQLDLNTASDEILPIIERLLGDSEPMVLSSVLLALRAILERGVLTFGCILPSLHKNYHRLVGLLESLDGWGQYAALDVLYRYCLLNFTIDSTSPDLQAFITALDRIVRFSCEPFVVQLGVSVLADLGAVDDTQVNQIIFHNFSKLAPGSRASFIEPLIPLIRCKPERYFVNLGSDSEDVVLQKVRILAKAVSEKNCNSILTETGKYLRHFEGIFFACDKSVIRSSISDACIRLITRISTGFPGTAPVGVAHLMIFGSDPELNAKKIAGVAAIISNLVGCEDIKSDELIKSACGVLTSGLESAAIGAVLPLLTLLTACHDIVPLIVPNVISSVAAKDLEHQDPFVKLQLHILSAHAVEYHERNASGGSSGVPSHVSRALLTPLKELSEFVYETARMDSEIGQIVMCVDKDILPALVAYSMSTEGDRASSEKATIRNDNMYSRVTKTDPSSLPTRPNSDSSPDLRLPLGKEKTQKTQSSFSYEQSSMNRMYTYPATLSH